GERPGARRHRVPGQVGRADRGRVRGAHGQGGGRGEGRGLGRAVVGDGRGDGVPGGVVEGERDGVRLDRLGERDRNGAPDRDGGRPRGRRLRRHGRRGGVLHVRAER